MKKTDKECSSENPNSQTPQANSKQNNFIQQIISLENPSQTVQVLIGLYIMSIMLSHLSDHFILFFVMNFCIFYGLIEKYCPFFLFKGYMLVKQVIEGVFGIVVCAIPSYEDLKVCEQGTETPK